MVFIPNFHAWSGNKGVEFLILTLLTPFFTTRVEIKGSELGFFVGFLTTSQHCVNYPHTYVSTLFLFKFFFGNLQIHTTFFHILFFIIH